MLQGTVSVWVLTLKELRAGAGGQRKRIHRMWCWASRLQPGLAAAASLGRRAWMELRPAGAPALALGEHGRAARPWTLGVPGAVQLASQNPLQGTTGLSLTHVHTEDGASF